VMAYSEELNGAALIAASQLMAHQGKELLKPDANEAQMGMIAARTAKLAERLLREFKRELEAKP